MNNNDKLREAEIKITSKKASQWDNFWYHYKWPVIIVSFFVIVVLVCTLQTCGKEEEDITILYAGPAHLASDDITAIENVMNFIMPKDFNKNGSKQTELISYHIMSKDQILDAEDGGDYVDRSYNSANNDNYYDYIMTGETSICVLDPALYSNLVSNDRLVAIKDALGAETSLSEDGYGIKLSTLEIYDAYGVLKKLPEDSVVCVLRPTLFGRTSKEANFENDKAMFKAIIEFDAE